MPRWARWIRDWLAVTGFTLKVHPVGAGDQVTIRELLLGWPGSGGCQTFKGQ